MKFREFDELMRKQEEINNYMLLPNMYTIIRIDGRNFHTLTRETLNLEPFDPIMHKIMIETTKHLMTCGFNIVYGYTQSDEISLLCKYNDLIFNGKQRKYISILASEASAKFTMLMNTLATFDARTIQVPLANHVVDYFMWRNNDAFRNGLNMWCYYIAKFNQGLTGSQVSKMLEGKNYEWKLDFLHENGIDFNDGVSSWHKNGTGLYFNYFERDVIDQKTNQPITILDRNLIVDDNLPKHDYRTYLHNIVAKCHTPFLKKSK